MDNDALVITVPADRSMTREEAIMVSRAVLAGRDVRIVRGGAKPEDDITKAFEPGTPL